MERFQRWAVSWPWGALTSADLANSAHPFAARVTQPVSTENQAQKQKKALMSISFLPKGGTVTYYYTVPKMETEYLLKVRWLIPSKSIYTLSLLFKISF